MAQYLPIVLHVTVWWSIQPDVPEWIVHVWNCLTPFRCRSHCRNQPDVFITEYIRRCQGRPIPDCASRQKALDSKVKGIRSFSTNEWKRNEPWRQAKRRRRKKNKEEMGWMVGEQEFLSLQLTISVLVCGKIPGDGYTHCKNTLSIGPCVCLNNDNDKL